VLAEAPQVRHRRYATLFIDDVVCKILESFKVDASSFQEIL
jgi:hypothetical protein